MPRVVNRKPKVVFSVGFFVVFFLTENRLFSVGFRLPKKNATEKPTRFFRSVLFYSPQQQKPPDRNRPTFRWRSEKPTEAVFIFGSQPPQHKKNDRNRPTFRRKNEEPTKPFLFAVYLRLTTNPGRPMIPSHAHWMNPLKCWRNRLKNLPRSVCQAVRILSQVCFNHFVEAGPSHKHGSCRKTSFAVMATSWMPINTQPWLLAGRRICSLELATTITHSWLVRMYI